MLVRDIMTEKIVSIDSNESIRTACNKYRDTKVGCLIVTANADIVGIVTERDLIERAVCANKDLDTVKIKEIMTPDVKSIDIDERVENAVRMLKENKIKKLPVTSSNNIVGIITITDIAYSRPSIKSFIGQE